MSEIAEPVFTFPPGISKMERMGTFEGMTIILCNDRRTFGMSGSDLIEIFDEPGAPDLLPVRARRWILGAAAAQGAE
jgi:hypothetical protein